MLLLSQQPGIGGAERLALEAAARAHSLEVTVVAPEVQCRLANRLGLNSLALELPRIRDPFLGPFRFIAGAVKVRRLARELGIQVLYANASRAMGYGIFARLLGGPPVLVHNHHLLRRQDVTKMEGGFLSRGRFVRALQRWADLIVVPSESAAQAFDDRSKVEVIPNGVDLTHFHPSADKVAAKRALGLPGHALVVGTVTRADPEKGMAGFLRLVDKLSHHRPQPAFILVGGASFPHEKEFYRDVSRAAAALPAEIVVTGVMDDPLLAFQAMDVMAHTGELPESFGLTVAEAMACGVPVVGFDWGGVSDIVINGETGRVVRPLDLDSMALAIAQLLDDPDTRSVMGLAARKRCEDHYDIQGFARRMESLVQSMAQGSFS